MDNDDINNDIININNDIYVIAFKQIVHCLPIHNYVINVIAATITYYCGHNNTFILPIDNISKIINNK
jgi:hypothetical protein